MKYRRKKKGKVRSHTVYSAEPQRYQAKLKIKPACTRSLIHTNGDVSAFLCRAARTPAQTQLAAAASRRDAGGGKLFLPRMREKSSGIVLIHCRCVQQSEGGRLSGREHLVKCCVVSEPDPGLSDTTNHRHQPPLPPPGYFYRLAAEGVSPSSKQ